MTSASTQMILTIKFDTKYSSLIAKRLTIEDINSSGFFSANLTIEIALRFVFVLQQIKNIDYKFKFGGKILQQHNACLSQGEENCAQSMNHGRTLDIL